MTIRRETWINLFLFFGLVLLGLCVWFLLVQTKPALEKSQNQAKIPQVYTRSLAKKDLPVRFEAYGNTSSSSRVQLRAQVPGTLTYLNPNYREGAILERGEILIRIEQREYQLALEKAQAMLQVQQSTLEQIFQERSNVFKNLELSKKNLKLNEKELERYAQMIREQTVTEQAYENILQKVQQQRIQVQNYENSLMQIPNRITLQKANIASARVAVQEAMIRLEKTEIHSPFTGQLKGKQAEVGEFIPAGTILGTLVGLETLELEVPVPQSEIQYISLASPQDSSNQTAQATKANPQSNPLVTITPLGPNGPSVKGMISRFGTGYNPKTRTLPVFIELKNTLTKGSFHDLYLHPGTFCKVSFEGKIMENIYEVDRTSFLDGKIQVLRRGKVQNVTVDIIRDQGEFLWVRGSILPGDELILRHNELYEEGKDMVAVPKRVLP